MEALQSSQEVSSADPGKADGTTLLRRWSSHLLIELIAPPHPNRSTWTTAPLEPLTSAPDMSDIDLAQAFQGVDFAAARRVLGGAGDMPETNMFTGLAAAYQRSIPASEWFDSGQPQ